MERVKCGVVGCGNVSDIYFQAGRTFEAIEIVACADLLKERAKAKAREHNIAKALPPERLLDDPDVQIVINLTVPRAHGEIALRALGAGKHVYNEKPIAVERDEARRMLAVEREKGLRVGCAPDTFLGAGLQTCRKILDEGWIGAPVSATAFLMHHGHEHWHPDPAFFFERGGGPLFDMGPYYLTAMCALLGPVRRVSGLTSTAFRERIVTSAPRKGERIEVTTPTHVAGMLEFQSSVVASMIMSFDVWGHHLPCLEIHGTEGSMMLPDPNTFGGPAWVKRGRDGGWREMPLTHAYEKNSRGLGVADMACALRSGRAHRANGELAYHVLDAMHAFGESASSGQQVVLESRCERPAPMPTGLAEGEVDP